MPEEKIEQFNLIISGTGGQGLITLLGILNHAAFAEGYDVKSSELHGLSQRGGSVDVHMRFGKKINSPLVKTGGANLIISLEAQEALREAQFASKEAGTVFLINNFIVPIPGAPALPIADIEQALSKNAEKVIIIPASAICQKEVGNGATAGVYLVLWAAFKRLIPLDPQNILDAVKKEINPKYLDVNLKAFELVEKNAEENNFI